MTNPESKAIAELLAKETSQEIEQSNTPGVISASNETCSPNPDRHFTEEELHSALGYTTSEELLSAFSKSKYYDPKLEHKLAALLRKEMSKQSVFRLLLGGVASDETARRANVALDTLAAIVPKRIATEEIGDALEFIDGMRKKGRPAFLVGLKVFTTYWWVILHTILHYAEQVLRITK